MFFNKKSLISWKWYNEISRKAMEWAPLDTQEWISKIHGGKDGGRRGPAEGRDPEGYRDKVTAGV